jgi:hypothetical protein
VCRTLQRQYFDPPHGRTGVVDGPHRYG